MYRTVNPGKPGQTDSWEGQEAVCLTACHPSVPREVALSGSILTTAHSSILEAVHLTGTYYISYRDKVQGPLTPESHKASSRG